MTLCESTSSVPCSPSCTHGYGYRCAPTVDLVLLSHGDLSHSGLYAYAYANWGLTAPTYTTLPVQAMARVAASEDVEGIRDEQDVEDKSSEEQPSDDPDTSVPDEPPQSPTTAARAKKRRYVATSQQVIEAFESVNVLRYSQPCHLQGTSTYFAALSPLTNHRLDREVPGFDNNPVQRWSHSWWDNMEDSFAFCWHHPLRCRHEPHAGATFGRDCSHSTRCGRWRGL